MKRKYWQYLFHIAVLAGVIYAGMKYIQAEEFWKGVKHFQWSYAPMILTLTVIYTLLKGYWFVQLLKRTTRIKTGLGIRAWWAGQPMALLPGGALGRAGLLEPANVPVEDSVAAVTYEGLVDQFVLITGTLIAALWVDAARKPITILFSGVLVIGILLSIPAVRNWTVQTYEWILRKVRLWELWNRFLSSLKEQFSWRTALVGVAYALCSFALMVIALELTLRGLNVQVPYSILLLAFTVSSMVGRAVPIPGGVGVTEASMVGIIDSASGVTIGQAAAAVAIFRVGTVFFAAIAGALVYFFSVKPEVDRINQAKHTHADASASTTEAPAEDDDSAESVEKSRHARGDVVEASS